MANIRIKKSSKIGQPLNERLKLEKVLGFTVVSNNCLDQSCDGRICYLAGCVVVIYDPNTKLQDFIISPARKVLTAVAFSCDGKLIGTGESGHDPKLRIWDCRDKIQLYEFGGHKFSIQCVGFLYNEDMILAVSIGSMHDMDINVWNVKSRYKVASNKVAQSVKGISFSENGNHFVTVGNRHVKFWYLKFSASLLNETVPLKGRSAILGDKKNLNFCDVTCGNANYSNLTYCLTSNGILCEFDENRNLSRSVNLDITSTNCIYADNEFLFIGCANGTTLIYLKSSLTFFASLPRPHYLGIDISEGLTVSHIIETQMNPNLKYPDCIAICYDKFNSILSTFYNDHSYYVWDLDDLNMIKKIDSHLYHASSCWSMDSFNTSFNYDNSKYFKHNTAMPLNSLITCGSDSTIRIWAPICTPSKVNTQQNNSSLKRNIYSKDLLKVIYVNDDLSALCENELSFENPDSISKLVDQNIDPSTLLENSSKTGCRSLKINPYGDHLATGDRIGNIRIYNLNTFQIITLLEVHNGEILDLDYSQPESNTQNLLLASASRDRTIQIFNVKDNSYEHVQTLDDHSAVINSVKFCLDHIEQQLNVISCGFDKSIMVRSIPTTSATSRLNKHFVRTQFIVEKQTFYDLLIEPFNNFIYTISQDRMVRTYSVKDGKKIKTFKGSLNEDGYLVKMTIDVNGELLATSCSDKHVYLWDLNSNECIAYIYGHSEIVTDLRFTADNEYLITISDGCIYFWRLNNIFNFTSSASNEIILSKSSPALTIKNQTTYKPMAQKIIVKPVEAQKIHVQPLEDNNQIIKPKNKQVELIRSQTKFQNLNTEKNKPMSNEDFISSDSQTFISQSTTLEFKETDSFIKPRACWGPEINTDFAVSESRVQSGMSINSRRTKSAMSITSKNQRIVNQKCSIL